MNAIVLHACGGPDGLRYEQRPDPEPGEGEVLVRVRACGVCYRDILDRRGKFPFIQLPVIPGHEFAGEVVRVAAGVTEWAPGDRVVNLHRNPCGFCEPCLRGDEVHCERAHAHFGLTANGGYATYVCAPRTALVRLPDAIPFAEGAVVMCTAAVAWRAVRHRADVRPGQTVLVTGASGGVGTMVIQIARLCGAQVVAVTSDPGKVVFLEGLGAERVLVDAEGGFHKKLDATGVDAAFEIVGRPTFNASLRSLKPGGKLVLIGNVTGERVEINPGLVILKALHVLGSDSCSRLELIEALRLVENGRLKVRVARSFPLPEAARAQAVLEERKATGRVVLLPE